MIGLAAGAGLFLAVLLLTRRPRRRRWPGPGAARIDPPSLVSVVTAGERQLERLLPARRDHRRDAQLPDALDRLGSALRAGQGLGPAIIELTSELPDPLGGELGGVAAALAHGAPLERSLATWATGAHTSDQVRLVAAALTLGAHAGGEVARAIDQIARTLRERRELHDEVRALATQARASAGVLVVAPLAFTALIATVEPAAIAFLVTTPLGGACLAVGLALDAVGATWMARITRTAA